MTKPAITAEEFDAWRDDPVTQWVFAACLKAAEAQRQAFMDASWDTGVANQQLLTELRTRADAYSALAETTHIGWCNANEEESPVE